ncbi:hypothetical protein MRB53_018339 [Persea americana]|uniref:Uncharacterized protein n=1 Tax=Persea americana TaxID=3435 RepID=A0ACC2M7K6_PERAE|nr:hypothetical protein MRB53_018339 [Persea americana]
MAGADPQKQLLTPSGDSATEESQSEQMLSDPRKHYSELQRELDAANADLENAKRSKKKIEDELRCFLEVESSLKDPSIQAQEAKISSGQQELQKALDAANGDLEKAKCSKDQIEHKLRSLEVQSYLEDLSIRAREPVRICHHEISESSYSGKKAKARMGLIDLDVYEIYYPPSHIYLLEKAGEETLIEVNNEVPYIIACELERTISLDSSDSSDQSDKSTAYCMDWFAVQP